YRRDASLLGLDGRGRGRRRVAHARPDQLRQRPAGPARPCVSRPFSCTVPERPDRGGSLSKALELAERALQAAEGDEVEAVVQTERSGLARFARSEVHQPTLIENEVVQLRIVRDGAVGTAAG